MSVCFNPYNIKTFTNKQKIKYKYIQDIKLHCNINKDFLYDIISFILAGYLDLSVIGYNNHAEEFWAKKVINNIYLLNFTLKIKSYGYENSVIIISPTVGDELEIKNLKQKFTDMLKLYDSY